MSRVIRIPESTFQRLQKLAAPLVDTPASVIEKLLDFYDTQEDKDLPEIEVSGAHLPDDLSGRVPRQRGVTVQVDGQAIKAVSVPDLYDQILRFICDKGHIKKLKRHLPLATSSKRYLIATDPVHPNGKNFVLPVKYKGYCMEAHKDYKNGVNHLRKMLDLCGLSLSYLT